MKFKNVGSLVGLLLAASAVQVNAGGEGKPVCIQILCIESKQPVQAGLQVVITSTEDGVCATVETDANGQACFTACKSDCYDVTVLGSTTEFCVSTPTTIEVSCEAPPGCPECVAPELGLGAAAGCTVLQLSTAKVSITGPAGGILGDICIAPGGSLSMSGDNYVTGDINLGAGAKFSNSSHGTVNVVQPVNLSAEISDAYARAASAAALSCDQSFAKLDGKTVTTITGGVGINVICVGDIVLSGKQIFLDGPAGARFIINVTGKFTLTGGGAGPQIRVSGGVGPNDVLYNIIGTGSDVAFSGGGGGVNCCAAIVDGTLLAPERKINLSPGLVNGQVISGKDISIVSGSGVHCPPCPK
jgi:choice-of-anchor A domain-containing protein